MWHPFGAGPPGAPGIAAQRKRIQTDTTGLVTWTFDTPFSAGVTPVISALAEAGSDMWDVRVQSVSNTAVTFQATRTTQSTLLGLNILAIVTNAQCWLHCTATQP